jgi:hypothetical protein
MQHNWSDEGDPRGWVMYDDETGGIELHPSNAPMFETIDVSGPSGFVPIFHAADRYLRVKGCSSGEQEMFRKKLMEEGARSVEFVSKIVEPKRLQRSIAGGFHLPSIVTEYEKEQEVDEERSKVGKELMK